MELEEISNDESRERVSSEQLSEEPPRFQMDEITEDTLPEPISSEYPPYVKTRCKIALGVSGSITGIAGGVTILILNQPPWGLPVGLGVSIGSLIVGALQVVFSKSHVVEASHYAEYTQEVTQQLCLNPPLLRVPNGIVPLLYKKIKLNGVASIYDPDQAQQVSGSYFWGMLPTQDTIDIPERKRRIATFLLAIKKNKFNTSKDVFYRIISYSPSLVYNEHLFVKTMPNVQHRNQLSSCIAKCPLSWLKRYVTNHIEEERKADFVAWVANTGTDVVVNSLCRFVTQKNHLVDENLQIRENIYNRFEKLLTI